MESTLSATATTSLFGFSKALNYSTAGGQTLRNQLALFHVRRTITATKLDFRRSSRKLGSASPLFGFRNVGGGRVPLVGYRLECVSSSAASFASGGGGIGGGGYSGGGGGGGGGGADGGEVKATPIAGGADDISALSSDVIILDVGGMTCGGCAASVKRILESQPLVSSASVNLTTETAIVWPISEAKVTPNWQKVLGEELAKHLSTCGFNSNLRGEAATEGVPS